MATNDFSNSSVPPGLPARSGFQSQSYYNSSQNRPQGNRNNFRTPSPYPRPRSSASKPNHNASFSPKYQNSYNSYNMPNPGTFNSPKFQNTDFQSSSDYFMSESNQSFGNYNANESYEAKDMKQSYNNQNDYYQCSDSDTSYNTCDSSFQSPITPNAAHDSFANRDFHDVRGQQTPRGRNFMRSNKYTNYPAAANINKWSPAPTGSKRPVVAASNQPTAISDPYVPQMQQALKSARNGGYRPPVYYSTDDPVTQTVEQNITETESAPPPPKKQKVVLRCDLCDLDFTSQIPLDMHLTGAKHAKKLKSEEILKALQTQGQAVQAQDKSKALHCEICNIMANSSQQLQMHLEGTKHKNRSRKLLAESNSLTNTEETADEPQQNGGGDGEGDGDAPQILSSDPDQPKPAKAGRFYCEICSVTLNSELQLQQHTGSKKHQAKVEGKPLPSKKWWKKKKNQIENATNSTEDTNSTQEESNSTLPTENVSETPQTVFEVQAVEETFVKGEVVQ